jgi:hypothetical protein
LKKEKKEEEIDWCKKRFNKPWVQKESPNDVAMVGSWHSKYLMLNSQLQTVHTC